MCSGVETAPQWSRMPVPTGMRGKAMRERQLPSNDETLKPPFRMRQRDAFVVERLTSPFPRGANRNGGGGGREACRRELELSRHASSHARLEKKFFVRARHCLRVYESRL